MSTMSISRLMSIDTMAGMPRSIAAAHCLVSTASTSCQRVLLVAFQALKVDDG